MADILTTFTPSPRVDLFGDLPPGTLGDHTYYPRGRVEFKVVSGAITAKSTSTDTATVITNCNLPIGYGYAFEYGLMNAQFSTAALDADNFSNVGKWLIDDGSDSDGFVIGSLLSQGGSRSNRNAGSEKTWEFVKPFCPPFYSRDGSQALLQCQVFDTDTADATETGVWTFYASFLQFTMRQVTDVRVNSPTPVRMC